MSAVLACFLGALLDACLGASRSHHVQQLFARYAAWLESHFNAVTGRGWRSHGVSAWGLAVLPWVLLAYGLSLIPYAGWWLEILMLYWGLGLKKLTQQALPIAQALRLGDLAAAQQKLSLMLSRQTECLDAEGVARVTTESVLENGSDKVFAALFWFAVLGGPGVVLYRLSNTLDAMWGYRTERYVRFGWAAARIDDVLGYLPARLTALTYAALGHSRGALRCWQQQAAQWASPNAGSVLAAGAGALQVRLGGCVQGQPQTEERPVLGEGAAPQARDIERALNYVYAGVGLWLLGLIFWSLFFV